MDETGLRCHVLRRVRVYLQLRRHTILSNTKAALYLGEGLEPCITFERISLFPPELIVLVLLPLRQPGDHTSLCQLLNSNVEVVS